MCGPVRCQVARIGGLATLSELSKFLLCLQILLTEAYLGLLSSKSSWSTWYQHATIVRDCLHPVRGWAIHGISWLLAKILMAWWHAVAAWGEHLSVLVVLNRSVSLHSWMLLIVAILRAAIYNHTFVSLTSKVAIWISHISISSHIRRAEVLAGTRTAEASTLPSCVKWSGEGVHRRGHKVVAWKDLLRRLCEACTI